LEDVELPLRRGDSGGVSDENDILGDRDPVGDDVLLEPSVGELNSPPKRDGVAPTSLASMQWLIRPYGVRVNGGSDGLNTKR